MQILPLVARRSWKLMMTRHSELSFDKRISQEVSGDALDDEFKGYVFKIMGGCDKQGFLMKQESDDDAEEIVVRPIMSDLDNGEEQRSITYDELRQRLRKKIEELRGGRNNGDPDKRKKRNEKNDRKCNVQNKRKRDSSGADEKKGTSELSSC